MNRDSMDDVFLALACSTRRKILDIVKDRPGCGVKHVATFFTMSRIAVMKHLRMLVRAELLVSEKVGRNRKLYFNCVPIQMIYDRWTTQYSSLWASRLTKVKYRVEAREKAHARS
jgi:predicted transcriptional regulator